jgi:hypothetical protein
MPPKKVARRPGRPPKARRGRPPGSGRKQTKLDLLTRMAFKYDTQIAKLHHRCEAMEARLDLLERAPSVSNPQLAPLNEPPTDGQATTG